MGDGVTPRDPLADLRSLADRWRAEAALLRRRGAHGSADTLESAAEDLEDRLREWRLELLTLEQAAREAGLAYDTLQRKVAGGEIANAGEKGSPRVRRCDLHPWLDTPVPEDEDPIDALARDTLAGRSGEG